jgi:hypothetical protein
MMRDGSDEIEITPAMIEAGVDCAMVWEVENVSLDTLAKEIYRAMVLASRGRYLHRYA